MRDLRYCVAYSSNLTWRGYQGREMMLIILSAPSEKLRQLPARSLEGEALQAIDTRCVNVGVDLARFRGVLSIWGQVT